MSTRERLALEPFDLERLARGEALAGVTLPDGRFVAGVLHTEEMFVPTGERTTTPPRTRAATQANSARHINKMALVLQLTEAGQTNKQIGAALVERGLMVAEPASQIAGVKALRREARKLFGG